MATKNVNDAVDALFVRCISSSNCLKTFQHAASLVHRMARAPRQACWEHLAVALDEQVNFLRMLRTNHGWQANLHAARRDSALNAFYRAHRRRAHTA